MGNTASKARQRWAAANYRQVKVVVEPSLAESFKAACAASGRSVNGALAKYMETACLEGVPLAAPKIRAATRPQRRAATRSMAASLRAILAMERGYLGRIPENLQGGDRFADAEHSVDALEEAIDLLEGAYQ